MNHYEFSLTDKLTGLQIANRVELLDLAPIPNIMTIKLLTLFSRRYFSLQRQNLLVMQKTADRLVLEVDELGLLINIIQVEGQS